MKHLAFILDGNRRWAHFQKKLPWQGHEEGAKRVQDIVEWSLHAEIGELTLYSLSVQNLQRSKNELEHLFRIFKTAAKRVLKEEKKIGENGVRICAVGRLHLLPESLQKLLHEVMEKTKKNKKLTVNLCIAYGGREEITDAVRMIAEKVEKGQLNASEIDESLVGEHLYLNSEPDLIIRTGGTNRTSNFLPWQATYSEWHFTDTFLPAMTKGEFFQILDSFERRERRFGK